MTTTYRRQDLPRDLGNVPPVEVWFSPFPPQLHDLPRGTLHLMSLKEWADTFRRLPSLGEEHGIRLDDSDVSALMGENSARILKLD